jgi:hypothetical protein
VPKLEISKVHDAYENPGECPLCRLEQDAERTYLKSFQHSRVMEPNVRVQTNRQGFCASHFRKLYDGENKLGLSLVVHTHLQQARSEIVAELDMLLKSAGGRGGKDRAAATAAALSRRRDTCFICGLLREDMRRYVLTILYLWSKDTEFAPVFRASRGFCIPHFAQVLQEGSTTMRADRFARWLAEAVPLMKESLQGLEGDLHSFTQLHQAGSTGMGTDGEKSALRRTLQKLAGESFSGG